MGWNPFKAIKQAVTWTVKKVDQAVTFVADKVVAPVLKTIGNTIQAIAKDPLPVLAQIAGSFVGIPPYVTAAAITAARGGDLKSIATSAALAYAGSKAFGATSIGETIGDTAASAGDFTQTLAENIGISPTISTALGNAAQSGVTSAAISGIKAALTGQNIGESIAQGFTQGSISSGTSSYFNSVKSDWGITSATANQLSNITSTAAVASIAGKDAEKAVTNYIAYATLNTATSELKNQANSLWNQSKDLASKTTEAKADYDQKQAEYDKAVAEYQNKVNEYNEQLKKLNDERDPYVKSYESNLAEYNKQKAIYDNESNTIETRNAAADLMATYAKNATTAADAANAFNTRIGELNIKSQELSQLNTSLTDVNADGIAKSLKQSADTVQANYDNYNKTIADAKKVDDQYGTQVAEVAAREALIDSLNNKSIKTIDNPDAPEGSITLENGIVITADGRYLQDGKEIFSNASPIKQSELDFKTEDGNHYVFDDSGKRLNSETDTKKFAEDNFGIKLTDKEAKELSGVTYGTLDPIKTVAEEKVVDEFKKYGYEAPPKEEIDSFLQKGGNTIDYINQYVDPYSVTKEEVNQYFNDVLGRDATPEELKKYTGAQLESDVLTDQLKSELMQKDILQKTFGEYGGEPVYAETATPDFAAPSGYKLASISDVYDIPNTGAVYDEALNAWLVPTDRLSNVNVTATEDVLQDYFGDYYSRPSEELDSLSPVEVTASPEEDNTLPNVNVYGRPEEPLIKLPTTPIVPKKPIPNVVVPKTQQPPTVPAGLMSFFMPTDTGTQAVQPPVPVVQESPIFDIGAPLDIGFFNQPTSQDKTTQDDERIVKIASGGYMDNPLSMDEILQILEGK